VAPKIGWRKGKPFVANLEWKGATIMCENEEGRTVIPTRATGDLAAAAAKHFEIVERTIRMLKYQDPEMNLHAKFELLCITHLAERGADGGLIEVCKVFDDEAKISYPNGSTVSQMEVQRFRPYK
jgi:hypothetical protein